FHAKPTVTREPPRRRFARGTGELTPIRAPAPHQPLLEHEVAQIVHDLKNPLSAISLEAALMEQWLGRGDPERCAPSVARIQGNVEYLDRIVQDLLDVCAFAAGSLVLRRSAVDLCALIDQVVERLPGAPRDRVLVETCGPVIARVDDIRIQRVLANLLDNALHYSSAGSRVMVTLSAVRGCAQIAVADSGPGIPSHELGLLFDRYQRGSLAAARPGSGLGLHA